MSNTLISFIGTGQKDQNQKGQVYVNAEYDFGNSKLIKAAVFFDAVLQAKLFDIQQCILIGTYTSTWSALLDRDLRGKGEYIELYEQIEEQRENNKAIANETLAQLQQALEKIWGIPCLCYANDPAITGDNCFGILCDYFELLSTKTTGDLVIDITHGFRSMPVLLMNALPFLDSLGLEQRKIQIIYGELNKGISPVRYLNPLWDAFKISQASRLFFDKFEAQELAGHLEPFWSSGAKAISHLSDIIQGNMMLRLEEALRQLQNAIGNYNTIEETPKWAGPIVSYLQKLIKKLTKFADRKRNILTLAEILAEKSLYGQAIITLQLSYEAFLFEYFSCEEKYGEYEVCQTLWQDFIDSGKLSQQDCKKIRNLRNARNTIAHGGSKSRSGGVPQVQNLPSQYQSYHNFLCKLY